LAAAQTPIDSEAERLSSLRTEYAETNNNFRMLADIRFKLLALVPALGGAANFILSGFALSQGATAPPQSLVLMIGVMGFLATLGITIYDQRNSELYNALISRAKYLEEILELREKGQFRERPPRNRWLFGLLKMSHDVGLSIIYGPVLGAWAFPVTYVVHTSLRTRLHFGGNPRVVALVAAFLMGIVFTVELLRHDNSLPWQKDSHEGKIVALDLDKGSLALSYNVRDLRRDDFNGEMTKACKEKLKKLIEKYAIANPIGEKLVVHYWTKRTKTEGYKIDKREVITNVMFVRDKSDRDPRRQDPEARTQA
jgi:hypothetical protein